MKMYKPFAHGPIRAAWITTRDGSRVLRISGGIKQRQGHQGIEMSPYLGKALAEWLASELSDNCDAATKT